MSVLTRNYFPTQTDVPPFKIPNDGRGQIFKPSKTSWNIVDKSMYLDMAVACVSCLGDATETTQNISFKRYNHDEEQIKQLEFMLGELKIDMQILFERKCFTSNETTSTGSMTFIETKEAIVQTDNELKRNSSCDIDHANVNIPNKLTQSNHSENAIHEEKYQTEILRLRQENDKWERTSSDQKQTIESLCCEIEQKNQLLTSAKVFIDEKIKNTEKHPNNADAIVKEENFQDKLIPAECQQCTHTTDLLAEIQVEKDILNLQKNQLEKIVLSYEAEIQTLDRNLQKNIEKNVHFEQSLDFIRKVQSEMKLKNEQLTQEADQLRKQVALLDKQNKCVNQTKDNLMSQNVDKMPISQNSFDAKTTTVENIILSTDNENKSIDEMTTQNVSPVVSTHDNVMSSEITHHVESTDIILDEIHVKTKHEFNAKSSEPSISREKSIENVNSPEHCLDAHVTSPLKSEIQFNIVKQKTMPTAIKDLKQIDRKIRSESPNVKKRSITADKKGQDDMKKIKLDKEKSSKTIISTKSKPRSVPVPPIERSKCNLAKQINTLPTKGKAILSGSQFASKSRSISVPPMEKAICHLAKPTNTQPTSARAMSTGSYARKNSYSENQSISSLKTMPYQPQTRVDTLVTTGYNKLVNKRPLSAQRKENQRAETNVKKQTMKPTNSQDVAPLKKKIKTKSIQLTTNHDQKVDKITSNGKFLIRVVRDVDNDNSSHKKSLTIANKSCKTTINAREERLHKLCELITVQDSIDTLSLDDLNFLNENLNDKTMSDKVSAFAPKINLKAKQHLEYFENQVQKSKETLDKGCNIF